MAEVEPEVTEPVVEVEVTNESVSESSDISEPIIDESGTTDATETAETTVELTTAEQIGQFSRIAAQNTDSAIEIVEKSIKSINEFIRAKKYALSFSGETDRKIAIWLQVAEYENEIDFFRVN